MDPDFLKTLASSVDEVKKMKGDVEKLNVIMVGIVIVFFVGFLGVAVAVAAMTVEAYRAKEASYQQLIDKIDSLRECSALK